MADDIANLVKEIRKLFRRAKANKKRQADEFSTLVDSSAISAISYDNSDDEGILTITFESGSVYEYYSVSKSDAYRITLANSVGKSFNNNIKDIYDYERIS